MKALLTALSILVAALASSACAPIVGDACDGQTDCGRQMFCELSMPGGYCTIRNCTARACPEQGVCIRFTADVSYCMQTCGSDLDCRAGYVCVMDFGPTPFCNDARGTPPGT